MCFVSSEWPPQSHQLILKSTFLPNFNIFFLKSGFHEFDGQATRQMPPATAMSTSVSMSRFIYLVHIYWIWLNCSWEVKLQAEKKKKSSLAAAAKA